MKKTGIFIALLALLLIAAGGCGKNMHNGGGAKTSGPAFDPTDVPTPTPTATVTPTPGPGDNTSGGFDGFRITFLSTGKSDCVIIEDRGTVIMNDAADADDYSLIEEYLSDNGIAAIDYLIISHFDKDHIGTASALINNGYVRSMLIPDYVSNSNAWKGLMVAAEQTDLLYWVVNETMLIDIPDGKITVNPTEMTDIDDENNYSLITTVIVGDKRILLPGDALKKRLEEFTETPDYLLAYDIIKSPHHGDYNKKFAEILKKSGAGYLVITSDPHNETTEKDLKKAAQRYGAEMLYTKEGNIVFEYENDELVLK